MNFQNGLDPLLRPEDSVLVLIDHPLSTRKPEQSRPHMVTNNAAGLAKAAKAFNVPTILTSDRRPRRCTFPQITDVFPGQEVVDRTFINTWEDQNVVDAEKRPAASS